MLVPLDGVHFDEASDQRLVQVVVLDGVIVAVGVEHPLGAVLVRHVLPVERVRAERDHVGADPLAFARSALRDQPCDLRQYNHDNTT